MFLVRTLSLAVICALGVVLFSLRVSTHIQRTGVLKPLPLVSDVLDNDIRSDELTGIEKRENIEAFMRRQPLNARPYRYFALLDSDAKTESIIQLLKHAQRLNARDRLVSGYLVESYFAVNDFENLIAQIDLLCRLESRDQAQLTTILATITTRPQAFEKIKENIGQKSCWKKSYMRNISRDKELTPYADILIRQASRTDEFDEHMHKSMSYALSTYLETGQITAAIDLARSAPSLPDNFIETVSSGGSLNHFFPVPFAWRSIRSKHGSFKLNDKGLMKVEYDGRHKARLARHDLFLNAGRNYRLEIQLELPFPKVDNLFMSINCQFPTKQINRLRFIEADSSGLVTTLFEVPRDGCPAQELILAGETSIQAKKMSINIKNIDVTKMDEFQITP